MCVHTYMHRNIYKHIHIYLSNCWECVKAENANIVFEKTYEISAKNAPSRPTLLECIHLTVYVYLNRIYVCVDANYVNMTVEAVQISKKCE